MGLYAGELLGLSFPQTDKRVFAFVECDGCGMGGISVATGCRVDRRTMRIMHYGKLAATFVDTETDRAYRIHPHHESRMMALKFGLGTSDRWRSQLIGYQKIPLERLFVVENVSLTVSLEKIISRPGLRVLCEACGEEIMNEREVHRNGNVYCRFCAGGGYYRKADTSEEIQGSTPVALFAEEH